MGSYNPTPNWYDVLIIGAGLSGIYSLHHIRSQFPLWRVKVLEAGSGSGGTWYWNRYPGARFDSESVSYGFSFDNELLQDWHWKEAFSPQPETLRYIEIVCEKHKLYKDIQFNTRIKFARWQDDSRTWLFIDEAGEEYQTRFFVSCMGFLSEPTLPNIAGVQSFKGQSFHTSRWPQDLDMSKDFSGKRIGIIGTGATGIQTITEIAKESSIKSLTKYRQQYESIFTRCSETPMCFLHEADPRKSNEATPEERLALWEKLYSEPGFGKWLGTFKDTYTDREANKLYSDFMAYKIRARVHDPTTAEKLIPKSHGFGTRRVPLESGYFEAFNLPHVHLLDLQETPIEKITEHGVLTSDGLVELDVLIYATGFDAITGDFSAIDFHGKDDKPLLGDSSTEKGRRAVWLDQSPRTYLGMTVPSFPNMLMVLGPHQPFGNATRSIEHAVQVISNLLEYCHDKGYEYFEPNEEAVDQWTEHVVECTRGLLSNEVDSWMTGVNKNVVGKQVRRVATYSGSAVAYRKRCEDVQASGWEGLVFK